MAWRNVVLVIHNVVQNELKNGKRVYIGKKIPTKIIILLIIRLF